MRILLNKFCIYSLFILMIVSCNPNKYEKILLDHYKKYPLMEVVDYYKLIYQSSFGVKHLLIDTLKSKEYLFLELHNIEPKDEYLFENISIDSSIVRINLASFKHKNLDPNILFEVMKESANKIKGSNDIFFEYWDQLSKLIDQRKIPIDKKVFVLFTNNFENPLKEKHHSEIFVKQYNPHYRVVLKKEFEKYFFKNYY